VTRPQPSGRFPSVGIVIRTLNEAEHLGRLFTGIEQQTLKPEQVVVVDSGSRDTTVDIARGHGAEVVTIEPQDFSFGRSLNDGCAALDTDVIVIVSAHTYPVRDSWLRLLAEPFTDEAVAVAYGRQVGDVRTTFSELRLMQRWFPAQSTPRQSHPFCNNANAAVRRSDWERLRYDEDLTGLEDLDFARRALAEGRALSYVASASVVHVHTESWDRLRNRYRREAIAHRRIFADQRMSAREAISLGLRNIVADYASALRQHRLARNLVAIPRFQSAQFIGAYQGFSQVGEVTADLKRHFYFPTPPRVSDREHPGSGNPIDYITLEEHHAGGRLR
jgi:glycosyltransferase involved in cell wall biosynthesis